MPAVLNIISEQDIRDFVSHRLEPAREEEVREFIENDRAAQAVFERVLSEQIQGEPNMTHDEPVEVTPKEAKQGDNAKWASRLLFGSLVLAVAVGLMTLATFNGSA